MSRKFLDGKTIRRARLELQHEIEGLVGKEEYENFKKFAFQGDMGKMAVAFMLGTAFTSVVKGISDLLVMPVLTYVLSKTGTDWRILVIHPVEGMTIEIGKFFGVTVDFFLIAIVLYIFYQKLLFPILEKRNQIICIETKKCTYCMEDIHWMAERCPKCTSWQLEEENGSTE